MAPDGMSSAGANVRAAAFAGIFGGLLFLLLEMMLELLFLERSLWAPPRRIAALALGRDVLAPPATFEGGVMLAALLVHLALSVAYALVLALLVRHGGRGRAILLGAVFGLALYLVNYHLLTTVFPWFAEGRNWTTVLSHAAYGAGTAWAYRTLRRPLPNLPAAARAFTPGWSGPEER